jgi:hypothetical protein
MIFLSRLTAPLQIEAHLWYGLGTIRMQKLMIAQRKKANTGATSCTHQ